MPQSQEVEKVEFTDGEVNENFERVKGADEPEKETDDDQESKTDPSCAQQNGERTSVLPWFSSVLQHRFFVPLSILAIIVLQVVAIAVLTAGQTTSNVSVNELVKSASDAFRSGKDDLGIALLSAALVAKPDDGDALNLYSNRLQARFEKAVDDRDWSLAEVQLAAYDSALRDGLRSANNPNDVKSLVKRRETVREWDEMLASRATDELKEFEKRIESGEPIAEIESKIRQMPTQRFTEDLSERVAILVSKLLKQQNEVAKIQLVQQLETVEANATKTGDKPNDLRQLRIDAERIHADALELQLDGADVERLVARCREILSQLDAALQARSIRQMQSISDAQAIKALDTARGLLTTAQEWSKDTNKTWQSCGEKLVEAEFQLTQIDRLASHNVQNDSRTLSQRIRRLAIEYKAKQQRNYNKWAIGQLEVAISAYKEGKGIVNDDEEKFIAAMKETIGPIDPRHLHPVTHALYTEIYHKLLSELNNDQKVSITKAIESAPRKKVTEY